MSVCGTPFYANDVICEVINQLDQLLSLAIDQKDEAITIIRQLETDTSNKIANLSGIDYDLDTRNIPLNFTAPSVNTTEPDYSALGPTAPAIPDSGPLLDSTTIDDIWERAATRLTRVSTKEERDASYMASSMGLGLPSSTLLKRLDAAQQETNNRTSEVALEQAIQEDTLGREDTKALLALQVQQYSAAWSGIQTYLDAESKRFSARIDNLRANIAEESERRGWSELQTRIAIEEADKNTAYALQKAKEINDTMITTQQAVAQQMIGLTQSMFAASNYGLSGSGSQSVNTSVAG